MELTLAFRMVDEMQMFLLNYLSGQWTQYPPVIRQVTYAVKSGRLVSDRSNPLPSLGSSALCLSQSVFNFDQDKNEASCSRPNPFS